MQTDSEKRNPHDVQKMFARVSRVYDFVNHAMCFGFDVLWRKRLVRTLLAARAEGGIYLDIACGSGDVALEIARQNPRANIVAADFCADMLEVAKQKTARANLDDKIKIMEADCLHLPFDDNSFDGATISFGFRNFERRAECLAELARTIKPEGKIAMLEVARANRFIAPLQKIFMARFVPAVAALCGGNADDYKYLAKTTLEYPRNDEIAKMFESAGFANVKIKTMGFGLVAITSADK